MTNSRKELSRLFFFTKINYNICEQILCLFYSNIRGYRFLYKSGSLKKNHFVKKCFDPDSIFSFKILSFQVAFKV